jgi:putative membrane protein
MYAGLIPLILLAAAYGRGVLVLARRNAGEAGARSRSHLAAFAAGWIVLVLALVSPLHEASEQLFSAHMIQHELLMTVAAPLLVLSRPMAVFLWSLPNTARRNAAMLMRTAAARRTWRVLTRPLDAWLFHGLAIWIWHIPLLFQATLTNDLVHVAQHLSFIGSAVVFWWSILYSRRASRGVAVLSLFTTAVHTGVLGALMTFAHTIWYPAYAASTAAWGLTPLADQQLAGLIMWIPASIAYLLGALIVMRRWLQESEWVVADGEMLAAARSR